jgi:hypothetical protein
MRRTILLLGVIALIIAASIVNAAETTVEGRIYSSWSMYLNDTTRTEGEQIVSLKGWNEFSLDRSYVTVKSKLSDYTSLNITTDLRRTDGFSGYSIILKYGYADWKLNFAPDLVTLRLGLQPTRYIEAMDSQMWGRRYILNSVGDLSGFLTTSDLGATINFSLGEKAKYGSAGLSIFNGTSYTNLTENNKNKDINIYALTKPLVNMPDFEKSMLIAQFYSGTRNVVIDTAYKGSDFKHQIISIGGNLVYKEAFNVGVDYWMNTLGHPDSADVKQTAVSIFGTFYLKSVLGDQSMFRTLDLFGRVDMHDPNTDIDNDGNTAIILGVECLPIKGVAASINYRSQSFKDDSKSQNYLYLNTEFRF